MISRWDMLRNLLQAKSFSKMDIQATVTWAGLLSMMLLVDKAVEDAEQQFINRRDEVRPKEE